MARIDTLKMKPLDKIRNNVHEIVPATYSIFEQDGKRYLQVDTYGRTSRDMPEKISQSLQFDSESAEAFIELLTQVFSLNG